MSQEVNKKRTSLLRTLSFIFQKVYLAQNRLLDMNLLNAAQEVAIIAEQKDEAEGETKRKVGIANNDGYFFPYPLG